MEQAQYERKQSEIKRLYIFRVGVELVSSSSNNLLFFLG